MKDEQNNSRGKGEKKKGKSRDKIESRESKENRDNSIITSISLEMTKRIKIIK